MILLDSKDDKWKEDPIITELNKQLKDDNYFIILAALIGVIIGILVGSGMHDWLFHATK